MYVQKRLEDDLDLSPEYVSCYTYGVVYILLDSIKHIMFQIVLENFQEVHHI